MQFTGLTGAPVFRGNGQFDFGLTETVGKMLGRDQNNVIPGQQSTANILKSIPTAATKSAGYYTQITTPKTNRSNVLGWTDSGSSTTQQPKYDDGKLTNNTSGVDLSNPAKQTDYARSKGFDSWEQFEASNNNNASSSNSSSLLSSINKEFDSLLGGLGGQQSQEQDFIRSNADLQKTGINEQLGFGIQNLDNQRGQVRENQANTLSDLSQSLRDSARNVQMMLGARGANGSANDAASYALTKLYGNQRAGVQQQSNAQFNEIETAENNLKASAASMLNDVDTWANSYMSDIANRYNSLRQNIGSMKASARIEAIGQLESEVRAIKQQKEQYAMQIQKAARQRLMQLNDYKTQLSGSAQFDPRQQTFSEFGIDPGAYQQDQGFDYNPMALLNRRREEEQY